MRLAAVFCAALLVGPAARAALEKAPNDSWMTRDNLMIVEGRAIAITLIDPRSVIDLPVAGSEQWLFPHARASIAVHQVLQNRTGTALVAGDTIAALFVAGSMTTNADADSLVHIVGDYFPANELTVGVRGMYILHSSNGELWCSPKVWDSRRVREALAKFGHGSGGDPNVEGAR